MVRVADEAIAGLLGVEGIAGRGVEFAEAVIGVVGNGLVIKLRKDDGMLLHITGYTGKIWAVNNIQFR